MSAANMQPPPPSSSNRSNWSNYSSATSPGGGGGMHTPQRQRAREARRERRFRQRISLFGLLTLAVSPSFVALYFSSSNHHHHHHRDSSSQSTLQGPLHQHFAKSNKKSKKKRFNKGNSKNKNLINSESRETTDDQPRPQPVVVPLLLPSDDQHQQSALLLSPPEPRRETLHIIDSATAVGASPPPLDQTLSATNVDTTSEGNEGIICQITTGNDETDDESSTVCCARWEYNTDDWWLQHYDYEVHNENATHTCFARIQQNNNPQRLSFLQHVQQNQWPNSNSHDTITTTSIDDIDAFCQDDVQVNQISSGYAAALTSLTKSFGAALAQKRPFQYNRRHDRFHWNFSIRRNNSTNATNSNISSPTTSHWAYCPTEDMGCFYLPLGACEPQMGRHDDGFRGRKPPSTGAATAATANLDTKRERLEFLWLRRYAFRPRHVLRQQLYLFLQSHLTLEHQEQLARIVQHEQSSHETQQSSPSSSSSSCTAIHVRRGDVAFGKGRRYAAVQEYLDAGNITASHGAGGGETIILLTDDVSTIEEVKEFHSANTNINWIYVQRPRFLGSQGGFEGFIPSHDPSFEVVAILADMQLASYCDKLVHGKSGFVDLLVEKREREGLPIQTILLDIQQDKGSQPKLDPKVRAQQYLERIRQRQQSDETTVKQQ